MRVGLLLLIGFLLQDPELDEALRSEKARIAAKKALTPEERATYRPIGAQPRPPHAIRTFSLAVHPVALDGMEACAAKDVEGALKSLAAYYDLQSSSSLAVKPEVRKTLSLDLKRDDLAKLSSGSAEEKKIVTGLLALEEGPVPDATLFLLPGELGERGTSLWPHKAIHDVGNYLMIPAKGDARWGGILAHEFGHLLGLDDQYEDREAKVGRWCLMGTGYLGVTKEDAKPAPLCAICKAELGWNSPAGVDYATAASMALTPVEGDPTAAIRIPVNKDLKEALLLEARGKSLLVWHTGGGKPIEFLMSLPTESSDRLTPWSDPPFRARTKGSIDAWITDVRFEGGRAYFKVAPTGELTPLEQLRRSRVGKSIGK